MHKLLIFSFLALVSVSIQDRTTDFLLRRQWQPPSDSILLVPGFGHNALFINYKDVITNIWPSQSEFIARYDVDVFTSSNNYSFDGLIDSMKPLISFLSDIGYVPGKNLFVFTHDWRLAPNNKIIQTNFNTLVQKIFPHVIAFSTGGLIVEEYLKTNPNDLYIKNFIAVNVPFKGVGGNGLKAWIRGYNFDNQNLNNENLMKSLIKNSYSGYWLLPQFTLNPTINNVPAVQFLTNNGYLYQERYLTRSTLNLATKKIYYVATDSINTPFNYDTNTNTFTYTQGDGMVPAVSSLHAEYHNQPATNQIKIKSDNELYDTILALTNNRCDWRGKYKNGFYWFTCGLSDSCEDAYIKLYANCSTLETRDRVYHRVIGAECSESRHYGLTHRWTTIGNLDLIKSIDCVYGDIIDTTIEMCYENYTYNQITRKCNPPQYVEVIKNNYIDRYPPQQPIPQEPERIEIVVPRALFREPIVIGFLVGILLLVLVIIGLIVKIRLLNKHNYQLVYNMNE